MSQPTQNSHEVVVVNANIFISICSKEPSETAARAALADYTLKNWSFYAPSVIFAEVEFLTFDKRVVNVAAKNAPTVKVNLLSS